MDHRPNCKTWKYREKRLLGHWNYSVYYNDRYKWLSESCSVVSDSLRPHGLQSPWNSPGQNTGVGSHFLLQGIFLTKGLDPGLLHCRWILYQLNHQGSPRILEWVIYPFSSGTSQPKNWTGVFFVAGRFFTSWAMRGWYIDMGNMHFSKTIKCAKTRVNLEGNYGLWVIMMYQCSIILGGKKSAILVSDVDNGEAMHVWE